MSVKFRTNKFRMIGAVIFSAWAGGFFLPTLAWGQAVSAQGVTKGAFIQKYFLDKFKRTPAARRYLPAGVDALPSAQRLEAVAKSLAAQGVPSLMGSRPDQPLTRVEYITLTYLLAGGEPGTTLGQQKAFLKERGVLNPADIGHVKKFQGDITVTHDGSVDALKLTGAEPVLFRDLDETDFGARLEIQLDDGSVLTIGEDTALRIDEMIYDPKTKRRSVSLRVTVGTIRIKASKNHNPGSRFQVITPTTVTGVRGTEFTVSVDEQGRTKIITLEGAVAVRPVREGESRPTSRSEQKQGAPPEKKGKKESGDYGKRNASGEGTKKASSGESTGESNPTDTGGDAPAADNSTGTVSTDGTSAPADGIIVKAGESTEVTPETTQIESQPVTQEELQRTTEATQVTEPTGPAPVTTADTQMTETIVQTEIAEGPSSTVDSQTNPDQQPPEEDLQNDKGVATQEITTAGSIGDGSLTTSTTPTNGSGDLSGLTGAALKSAFFALSPLDQALRFGRLTAAQQESMLALMSQSESETLLSRFKPADGASFSADLLDSLLDFGAAASSTQIGYVMDNIVVEQAVEFINCDDNARPCVGDNDKDFYTDGSQTGVTAFGQAVLNSMDAELNRLASAVDPSQLLLASLQGGTHVPVGKFKVAEEVFSNLDDIHSPVTFSNQLVRDIWGGRMRPSDYSVNGGYQAGQLRPTYGGGSGSGLISIPTRINGLNNNGFLSFAVQVEEDIVNAAVLEIRSLASGSSVSGTLNGLVNNQLAMSDIRSRDALLASQADARAGLVLKGSSGERIRVQLYVYRPPSDSDEVRMTSVSLGAGGGVSELNYLDLRVTFAVGALSGKTALQIRGLQWSDYFTLGFTDIPSTCNSSNCYAAVASATGEPLLESLRMEMGNGAGDYIREKISLSNTRTTGASLYDFGASLIGSTIDFQRVTQFDLKVKSAGGSLKNYTVGSGASPVFYNPQLETAAYGGTVPTGEYRFTPRAAIPGPPGGPPAGHPDGFDYVVRDAGITHYYPIRFAVVGDATAPATEGLQTSTCGASGSSSCASLGFEIIWQAFRVYQPASNQGVTSPNIGANILEISADPNGGLLSESIRNYMIPWPRMIWRGETNF